MPDRIQILIADDDSTLRRSLGQVLLSQGHVVDTSRSGASALEILRMAHHEGNPYDLLITDIRMPEMTGDQLIECLRSEGMELEIVVVSSFTEKELIVDLLRHGVTEFLEKPFTMSGFLSRMDGVLVRVRNRRERLNHTRDLETQVDHMSHEIALYRSGLQKMSEQFSKELERKQDLVSLSQEDIPGLTVESRLRPLNLLNGNFIGVQKVRSGFEVLVAHVEGSDMETSCLSILTKAFFENNAEVNHGGKGFLRALNTGLLELETGRKVTAVHARMDLDKRQIKVTSAGHPTPILQLSDTPCETLPNSPVGDPLGLNPEISLESWVFPLENAMRLFFFSNSLEAASPFEGEAEEESIGLEGLKRLLSKPGERSLKETIDIAWNAMLDHTHYFPLNDLLLLGLEWKFPLA